MVVVVLATFIMLCIKKKRIIQTLTEKIYVRKNAE